MTTREALEAALVTTPDDVALHSAYADYLIEENDPRGEYIRLHLAAEDRNQPADKLRQYEQAAFEIRQQYEREWLGELWPHLQRPSTAYSVAEPMEPNVSISWRRGWIDAVRVGRLSNEIVQAIAANPLTRVLSELSIQQNDRIIETRSPPYEMQGEVPLSPLQRSGRFRNLRHFVLGDIEQRMIAIGGSASRYAKEMPRLERLQVCGDRIPANPLFGGDFPHLHTLNITSNNNNLPIAVLGMNDLPRLRRLHLDLVTVMPGPDELGSEREPLSPVSVRIFFQTKFMTELQYLTLRMGEFADAGVEELLSSGFISRLKGLDLCRCNITDDGARLLAAHPHVPKLEYLHLDGNLLSPIGIDDLEAVGVTVSGNQFFAGGGMPEEY